MKVKVNNGKLEKAEVNEYINYGKKKYPNRYMTGIEITLDGDFVDLKFTFAKVPMERIRRITGYLVGTTDRFNNAKRAEVEQRVKHNF